MTQERAFWLAYAQIPGIGPILIRRLQQQFGSLATAWTARPSELAAVQGLGETSAEAIAQARRQIDPEQGLQQHERDNPCFWTPADADYPRLLLEIPDPPPVLYYRGEVNRLENQGAIAAIALVGTRSPSDYGRRWTQKLSVALAKAGFPVVSGLAAGVDTDAHQSCLRAGGRTLAVLGTGVDVVYPWTNRGLAQQISQQGLLLSEYPAGTQPDRVNFPRRNRIIAGLSRVTLVLEAPQKSGALITARLANEYGRDVYALPGSLDNPNSKGCLELLNQGAHVILGERELLDLLSTLPQFHGANVHSPESAGDGQLSLLDLPAAPPAVTPKRPPDLPPDLPPELQQVWHVVPVEAIPLDHLVEQTGMATGALLSALAQLELLGLVAQLPGMRYQRES